jgi:hypothetical protein
MWQDRDYVRQLLDSLPPAQRDVMACIMDDFSTAESALGLSTDAQRRSPQFGTRGGGKDLVRIL